MGSGKIGGFFYSFSIFKNAKTGNTYLWYACFLRLQMLFKAGITKAEIDAAMAVVGGEQQHLQHFRRRHCGSRGRTPAYHYPGPGSVRVKEAAQWM